MGQKYLHAVTTQGGLAKDLFVTHFPILLLWSSWPPSQPISHCLWVSVDMYIWKSPPPGKMNNRGITWNSAHWRGFHSSQPFIVPEERGYWGCPRVGISAVATCFQVVPAYYTDSSVNFSSSINKSQGSCHMAVSGFREKRQRSRRRSHASLNLSLCFTFIFRPCWSQISHIKHQLDEGVLLCTLSFLTWRLRHLPALEGQIRFSGYLVHVIYLTFKSWLLIYFFITEYSIKWHHILCRKFL